MSVQTQPVTLTRTTSRAHDLDSLRAILMVFVCLGHVLLVYATGPAWFIASPDRSVFLTGLAAIMTAFHMPGFFLLAGYFALKSLQRKPATEWLTGRVNRLLIPLATGMLVLSPFAIWAGTLAASTPDVAHPEGFSADFGANLMIGDFRWLGHLWFLPTLFMLSLGLWALSVRGWLAPALAWISENADRLIRFRLAWAFVCAGTAIWILGVIGVQFILERQFGFEPVLLSLIDPRSWLNYLPYFAIGAVFAAHPRLRAELTRITPMRCILIALAMLAYLPVFTSASFEGRLIRTGLEGLLGTSMTFLSMGLAARFLSGANAALSRLSELSLSIYLVHYPIVLLLGVAFQTIALNPILEAGLIAVSLMSISGALAFVIERSAILSFLFNGEPIRSGPEGRLKG